MVTFCCHCTQCQRVTGAAFAVNGLVADEDLELTGAAPEAVPLPVDNNPGQVLFRCPHCMVALWSQGRGIKFLRMGTLDDAGAVRPDAHIFTSTKQDWFALPEDAAAFEEFLSSEDLDRIVDGRRAARLRAIFFGGQA